MGAPAHLATMASNGRSVLWAGPPAPMHWGHAVFFFGVYVLGMCGGLTVGLVVMWRDHYKNENENDNIGLFQLIFCTFVAMPSLYWNAFEEVWYKTPTLIMVLQRDDDSSIVLQIITRGKTNEFTNISRVCHIEPGAMSQRVFLHEPVKPEQFLNGCSSQHQVLLCHGTGRIVVGVQDVEGFIAAFSGIAQDDTDRWPTTAAAATASPADPARLLAEDVAFDGRPPFSCRWVAASSVGFLTVAALTQMITNFDLVSVVVGAVVIALAVLYFNCSGMRQLPVHYALLVRNQTLRVYYFTSYCENFPGVMRAEPIMEAMAGAPAAAVNEQVETARRIGTGATGRQVLVTCRDGRRLIICLKDVTGFIEAVHEVNEAVLLERS